MGLITLSSVNRNEPGAVLTTKKRQGGIDSAEDHSNGKKFAVPGSSQCPVEILKAYLSHLNPDLESPSVPKAKGHDSEIQS